MIVVKMKVYHCTNAEDNPIPVWMQMKTQQKKMPKKTKWILWRNSNKILMLFFRISQNQTIKNKTAVKGDTL